MPPHLTPLQRLSRAIAKPQATGAAETHADGAPPSGHKRERPLGDSTHGGGTREKGGLPKMPRGVTSHGHTDPGLDMLGLDQYGSGFMGGETPLADAGGDGAGGSVTGRHSGGGFGQGASGGGGAGALPPPLGPGVLASASRMALQEELSNPGEHLQFLEASLQRQRREEEEERRRGGPPVGFGSDPGFGMRQPLEAYQGDFYGEMGDIFVGGGEFAGGGDFGSGGGDFGGGGGDYRYGGSMQGYGAPPPRQFAAPMQPFAGSFQGGGQYGPPAGGNGGLRAPAVQSLPMPPEEPPPPVPPEPPADEPPPPPTDEPPPLPDDDPPDDEEAAPPFSRHGESHMPPPARPLPSGAGASGWRGPAPARPPPGGPLIGLGQSWNGPESLMLPPPQRPQPPSLSRLCTDLRTESLLTDLRTDPGRWDPQITRPGSDFGGFAQPLESPRGAAQWGGSSGISFPPPHGHGPLLGMGLGMGALMTGLPGKGRAPPLQQMQPMRGGPGGLVPPPLAPMQQPPAWQLQQGGAAGMGVGMGAGPPPNLAPPPPGWQQRPGRPLGGGPPPQGPTTSSSWG